jgi:hypothetical protein
MLSGEPVGTGSSAGFALVEGGTYLCSDCRPNCDCMDRRGLVCFIFPTDHDPQVLTHTSPVARQGKLPIVAPAHIAKKNRLVDMANHNFQP